MNSKKKFLLFAVILNSVFFIGVAVWAQSQVQNGDFYRPMATWLAHNSSHFNRQFTNDTLDARTVAYQLLQVPTLSQKKQLLTSLDDIEMAFEFDGEKTLEIKGERKAFPFPQSLFTSGDIGFFVREKDLFLAYFAHRSAPTNVHSLITIKKSRKFIDKIINYSGTTLAIVEQDLKNSKILFTNLTDLQGQDLLSQFDFEKEGLPLDADKTILAQNVFYITLQRQKYLAVTINLTHAETFRQKLIYFIQAPDYESLSLQQLHLLLWTLFCISVGLTFFIARHPVD